MAFAGLPRKRSIRSALNNRLEAEQNFGPIVNLGNGRQVIPKAPIGF